MPLSPAHAGAGFSGDLAGEPQPAGRAVSFLGQVALPGEGWLAGVWGCRWPLGWRLRGLASPLLMQKPDRPLGHRGAWRKAQSLPHLGVSVGAMSGSPGGNGHQGRRSVPGTSPENTRRGDSRPLWCHADAREGCRGPVPVSSVQCPVSMKLCLDGEPRAGVSNPSPGAGGIGTASPRTTGVSDFRVGGGMPGRGQSGGRGP